jgi:hypothetical protein
MDPGTDAHSHGAPHDDHHAEAAEHGRP